MAGLNKVMIIGNLGADPEMKYMSDGTAMTTFRVAVSRNYTNHAGERREETEWFRVVAWRKTAEICSQYLQKGSKVYVEGRLQTRSWDTPEGEKRYMTEVVADTVQFLDRAGQGALGDEREPSYANGGVLDSFDRAPAGSMEPEEIPFE